MKPIPLRNCSGSLSNLQHVSPLERITPHSLLPAAYVAAFASFARATYEATRKAALLLFSVAMLLAGSSTALRAQSALDGFDPNADSSVSVVVVQPDGKILAGGQFGGAKVCEIKGPGVPMPHLISRRSLENPLLARVGSSVLCCHLTNLHRSADYLIANTTRTAYETNNSPAADCRR